MPASRANVFDIPASAPFLAVLVDALRAGKLIPGFPAPGDPLDLARATLYLPTRRACRLARDVFLERLDGEAAILPRIVALGDLDVDEIAFAEAAGAESLAVPDALDPLERRLTLARLIAKWAGVTRQGGGPPLVANSPAAAVALADDLARLMDDMTTRQVDWRRLDTLVPQELDEHWQRSLQFLRFVHPHWRAFLAEHNVVEAAERRDRLIAAEAKRLAASGDPVIAAGSTGSMPATAALLATIAHLPHGALVLPGLDRHLDETSWQLIGGRAGDHGHDGAPAAGHPQFALQALLARIGIARDEVCELVPPAPHGRETLVSEALRPAATTEHWQRTRRDGAFETAAESAMASLTLIEAANAEEEALAVAICLREAVETLGKRVALVTPDRALARRVVAALARWDVVVDDSGGDSLVDTPAGVFARLAAEAALKGLAPVTLLALLKHPLLRLGAGPGAHAAAVAALERAVLRGPRPRPGTQGLAHALATFATERGDPRDPRQRVDRRVLDATDRLVAALGRALAPLESLGPGDHPLAALAAAHLQVIAALAVDTMGEVAAFAGHDGVALEQALRALADSPRAAGLAIPRSEYPDVFEAAVADRMVRRPEAPDVRVHIYGPLEARLQSIDRVVLGGLNEGTWPPETRSDPWLSRPMRGDLGLDPPERRIGLAAHDFAQALGAPEVVLSRAAKVGGSPTVTSRFVQRLAALAGEARWQSVTARGAAYLDLARALDRPTEVKAAPRPAPRPPLAARPTKLSVTEIEHWLRDPYTIYAKHILRLRPLDAVDTPPGARDRGTVIHGAIGDYTEAFAAALPEDPEGELMRLGEQHFAPLADYPEARAFWWPRYLRIVRWFAGWDRERRDDIAALFAEIRGELSFPAGTRTFTLTGVADRIERRKDGTYVIIDYKTGAARTEKQVRTGLAPQLTLEGAMLRAGAFKGIAPGPLAGIAYVTLKGGEPPGAQVPIDFKDGTPDSQADHALSRLKALVATFEDETNPYYSLVHPMWKTHYGDYDHLARVKEWSLAGGAEGDEAL